MPPFASPPTKKEKRINDVPNPLGDPLTSGGVQPPSLQLMDSLVSKYFMVCYSVLYSCSALQ